MLDGTGVGLGQEQDLDGHCAQHLQREGGGAVMLGLVSMER